MPEEKKPPISRKALITVLFIMLLALFGGVGMVAYLGMFKTAKAEAYQAPAYQIAYFMHTGSYRNIGAIIEQVGGQLKEAHIEANTPAVLYLDDPGLVAENKLRSKVGYLVAKGVHVPAPLEVATIPAREVVRVTFDGSPVVGSFKAYEAMREWAKFHRYELLLPSLEIYHPDGWVEYQLSFRRSTKDRNTNRQP